MEILCAFPTAPCLLDSLFILTLHLFGSHLRRGKVGLRRLRQWAMRAALLLQRPSDMQHRFSPQTQRSLFQHFLDSRRCCFSHFQQATANNATYPLCAKTRENTLATLYLPNFQPDTCRDLIIKFLFPSETHAASHLPLKCRGCHSNGLVHGADGRE